MIRFVLHLCVCVLVCVALSGCRENTSPNPTKPSTLNPDTWNVRGVYQGHIWYYGKSRLSCDDVCASHGGIDQAGMNLIGSKTSEQMCSAVLDELGFPVNSYETGNARYLPYSIDVSSYSQQWQVGCGYASSYGETGVRLLYYPSNNAASGPNDDEFAVLYRVCACQQ